MPDHRFVLDTNAWISAALLANSVNRKALQHAEQNGRIVLSEETYFELEEVLLRKKFDLYLSKEDRLSFLIRVKNRYEIIDINHIVQVCRDRRDDKFINLALSARASYIISGDKDLLILNLYEGIRIGNAADFLNVVFDQL